MDLGCTAGTFFKGVVVFAEFFDFWLGATGGLAALEEMAGFAAFSTSIPGTKDEAALWVAALAALAGVLTGGLEGGVTADEPADFEDLEDFAKDIQPPEKHKHRNGQQQNGKAALNQSADGDES